MEPLRASGSVPSKEQQPNKILLLQRTFRVAARSKCYNLPLGDAGKETNQRKPTSVQRSTGNNQTNDCPPDRGAGRIVTSTTQSGYF